MAEKKRIEAGKGKGTEYVAVGPPMPCRFHQDEGLNFWCTHFQIIPKCEGDLNKCDVLNNSPDPRDGYK